MAPVGEGAVSTSLVEEPQDSPVAQSDRGGRRRAGDGTTAAVTSGRADVTSGERMRIPLAAYVGSGLFILAGTTVNALSTQADIGPRIAAWKPFVWEYSSLVTTLVFMPVIGALVVRTPIGRGRWLRFGLAHLAGTLGYCLVHVGGFVLIRKLAYAAAGERYVFGDFGRLVYEYRKDVMSYSALAIVFFLSAKLAARVRPAVRSTEPELGPAPEPDPTFDIRDGVRLIRAPVKEIVSVRSAGNYVEIHLADGRRPLMRTTLATVEAALAPHGFLRTHRSWLINVQRVRGLTPEGSGDWSVELEGGGAAPVSRRFPQALETLRRPA